MDASWIPFALFPLLCCNVLAENPMENEAPGPVVYFEAIPLGSRALFLLWKRPYEPNGLLTGYNIYYRQVAGEERGRTLQITDPQVTRAKLVGLKPDTKYRIDIRATTSEGPRGQKTSTEVRTNVQAEQKPDEPNFVWFHFPVVDGKAVVQVHWIPALEGYAGSHFFVQYRKKGANTWESSPPEENELYVLVKGLELGFLYEMKVVSVDGPFQTASQVQEIETGGLVVSAANPMENEGLFEGDIAGMDPYVLLDRNAVVDEAQLWPGGLVYYEIDWKLRDAKDVIMEAIQEYENKTCLRFRPKNASVKDYIKFTIVSGCWSPVGHQGGEQLISLSEGCHDKVSAVHELGHAIGLWHEHSRSDRDDYLEILWDNIKPGSEHNFLKLKPWENNLLGEEFDYQSIMLYGEYAFAKDRKSMTMRPRKEGVVIGLINNKPGLSDSDVRRVNKLYECFDNERPPPPDVPDFKCDFEEDMCGLVNEGYNSLVQWEIDRGELGGRTGSYLSIKAKDANFRKVRLVTPFFGAYGRKHGCLRFDVYFDGEGVVSLDITMHSVKTSKLVLKHVEKRDAWQTVQTDVDLEGDIKFSLDARTRTLHGDGVIALDNVQYGLRRCENL